VHNVNVIWLKNHPNTEIKTKQNAWTNQHHLTPENFINANHLWLAL